jgi:arylsulfatase A-like enzyme
MRGAHRASKLGRVLRRSLLAGVALAVGAGSVPALAGPDVKEVAPASVPAKPAARPNILFILVDDMGFADLSIMGNRKIQTPNIDRIAREGVLMTQFYDPAPICSASRAGFLTGRFPGELNFISYISGRESNAQLGQADWLDPKLPNIASMLKGAGYASAHIGKWHLGGGRDIGDAPRPTAYGFDHSFTTFEGLGPRVLVSDEERELAEQSGKLGNGPTFWEIKSRLTGLYCDMAVDFIAQHADQPWFVNLWLNDVHDPWAPDDDSLGEVMGSGDSADDDRMLATLAKMDKTLGRLFARLEQMGEMDNTLIVFTSDNGPSSMQRYYKGKQTAPGSVAAMRGRKWSNYEGGIRQPLILYWRGHAKAGHRDERSVGQGVDLLPTLASIAGTRVPAGVDGIDLSPVLRGEAIAERPALFWAYGKEGAAKQPPQPAQPRDVAPPFAVRDGKWKLLAGMGGVDPQLYDIAADPDEANDLAASQPAVRDRLLARLRNWMKGLPK